MKTAIVPAQVTTVEDKVAGNLSFTQLLLLTAPVFLDGAVIVLIPPFLKITPFKLVFAIVFAFICVSLAIRIKGRLLLQWLVILAKYRLRPGLYVYNKNDKHLRKPSNESFRQTTIPVEARADKLSSPPSQLIPTSEMVRLESAVANPDARFHLKATKGGLRVYIREVKEKRL